MMIDRADRVMSRAYNGETNRLMERRLSEVDGKKKNTGHIRVVDFS